MRAVARRDERQNWWMPTGMPPVCEYATSTWVATTIEVPENPIAPMPM